MSAATLKINMVPAMQELRQSTCTCSDLSSSNSQPFKSYSPTKSAPFTPLLPHHFCSLMLEISQILKSKFLPEIYTKTFIRPFYNTLYSFNENDFGSQIQKLPIENIVHAILQNFGQTPHELVPRKNTEALREVLSDLYQKFLNSKCSSNNSVNCLQVPSPVPNWTKGSLSIFPKAEWLKSLNVHASIINVPSRFATKGALAWGYFGSEAAGHDILNAYPEALEELRSKVIEALIDGKLDHTASHWLRWLEKTTSDVLEVLNMGPAAAFSLIGFLRSHQTGHTFKLRSHGYINDEHPFDLLRGYLVAYATQTMNYADLILQEVEQDAQNIDHLQIATTVLENKKQLSALVKEFLDLNGLKIRDSDDPIKQIKVLLANNEFRGPFIEFLVSRGLPQTTESNNSHDNTNGWTKKHITELPLNDFKKSAEIVAQTIMTCPLILLGNRSFSEIRCWGDTDEKCVKIFRELLKIDAEDDPVEKYKEGYCAAPVVAAALLESISEGVTQTKLQKVFQRMISILQTMHKTNQDWN